jgi:glycosyltransferase involved in cell wall biosynthesis
LAEAARRLGRDDVVVVTHDPRRSAQPGLRLVRARDAAEVRRLLFGAALAVVPRRISGGFPIKILNYMEAGLAILAFEGVADGLRHGFEAWLLPRHAGANALASAIRSLRAEPALASRLGANARRLLEERFGWKDSIPRTLGIATALADAGREGRRESALT